MAFTTTALPVTGTIAVAVDSIAGALFQRTKLDIGGEGVTLPLVAGLTTAANSLPVVIASDSGMGRPGSGALDLGKLSNSTYGGTGQTGVLMLGVRSDAGALFGSDGNTVPFSFDNANRLRVSVTGSGGTSATDESGFTPGTHTITPAGGMYRSVLDSVPDNSVGALAMTIKRALYVSHLTPLGDSMVDDTLDALNVKLVGGAIAGIVDDAAVSVGVTEVLMAGFMADETSTDSINEGDGGMARMTLDRKQIIAEYAHTAGGWTPVSTVSAATTNATSLKGSAGQVGAVAVTNVNAAMRYLKLYDKATAPTVGTDVPKYVIPLPGNTAGAGAALTFGAGLEFLLGIGWALTTGPTVADTGAVAASEIIVSIAYK